jgi:CRP-like cAMP-binding protein
MIVDLLQRIPFFSGVPPEALAQLAQDSFQKRYKPGDRVVLQGEYGHTMFVVVRGGLKVVLHTADGAEREISRLDQPGQFFGELAVISNARRSATVVADTEAILLEIEKGRVEKMSKDHKQVLEALEKLYEKRIIATYLQQCGHFVELDPKVMEEVVEHSTIRTLAREDEVYDVGTPNDALYLVKEGHLKMTRPQGNQIAVLAYLNAGDFFGTPDEGPLRTAKVTALGRVEVIRIPHPAITHKILESKVIKERLKKVQLARANAMLKVAAAGRTVMDLAGALLGDGQVEAASLLIIDLEKCVRCGNCSASCHDRHGASRIARRGKKLRRREGGFREGHHQHILVPSSCYHCANPECMIGCPTGAIHREKDGEVNIYDFCIGCSNCARRCPYDNITMAERADAGDIDAAGKKKSKQLATKCDLCKGYKDAACVSNCPTGAILRVDPKVYFEEIAALREGGQEQVEVRAKSTVDKSSYSWWPVIIGAAAVLAGLIALWLKGSYPRGAGSKTGLILGGFAAFACFTCTLLAVRRRLRRIPGNFHRWTQVHIALGTLGFVAALLHSNFGIHGWLTGTLLIAFGGVVFTGWLGWIIYKVVPPVVTRIEGETSQLVEDVENEREQLSDELRNLTEGQAMAQLARVARGHAGGLFARWNKRYNPEHKAKLVVDTGAIQTLIQALPPDRRADGRRVVTDVVRIADDDAHLLLYRLLRTWLALHIASTALLLTLLIAHIGAVLWWFV